MRAIGLVVAAGLLAAAVFALREATQSRHVETHPDSRSVFVLDASTNRAEPGRTARQMAAAQVRFCRLEVTADLIGPIQPLPDDPTRFRVVMQPALDDTDRSQFEGCVEDWLLDHLRLRVVSTERRGP